MLALVDALGLATSTRGPLRASRSDPQGGHRRSSGGTNHGNVKAVEYVLREPCPATSPRAPCTTADLREDVNNLSVRAHAARRGHRGLAPGGDELVDGVAALPSDRAVPLLSRTHGQPPTPTTFGKEMAVFVLRWRRQLEQLDRQEFRASSTARSAPTARWRRAEPDRDWEATSRRSSRGSA
jgi:adenylosuccinate lyase